MQATADSAADKRAEAELLIVALRSAARAASRQVDQRAILSAIEWLEREVKK